MIRGKKSIEDKENESFLSNYRTQEIITSESIKSQLWHLQKKLSEFRHGYQ